VICVQHRVVVFEHRFETAAGEQAQVDFAQFRTAFARDSEQVATLWVFTLVLGHSRFLWGDFVWSVRP
jgi:transposase